MTTGATRRTLAAALGVAPLWGCAGSTSPRGGLRIGVNALPATLEPVKAVSNAGNRVVNAIFDTLIRRDFFSEGANGSGRALIPGLAESWRWESDRALVLTLRKGVRFHDGSAFTVEDVAFSFSEERLWGDAALVNIPNGRKFSPDWADVDMIDAHTVRIRTRRASPQLENYLASWVGWIVPASYYRALGADGFGQRPVGTGPFRFVEKRAEDRIVLERFDAYWGGRPALSGVSFIAAPDRAARVAGLLSGQFDIVTTLTPDDRTLIDRREGFTTRSMAVETTHLACFQQSEGPTRDVYVRRAMDRAINRRALNAVLWLNEGDALDRGFTFPSYRPDYYQTGALFDYQQDEARRLLDQSGYGGEPIIFNAYGNYFANNLNALNMMLEWWAGIGLNVRPSIDATRRNFGKRHLFSWSHAFQFADPLSPLVTEFGPGSYVQRKCGWAAPAEFNDLCNAVKEEPDGGTRSEHFMRLRAIFREETPALILYRPVEVFGLRTDVDWRPISIDSMDFRTTSLRVAS